MPPTATTATAAAATAAGFAAGLVAGLAPFALFQALPDDSRASRALARTWHRKAKAVETEEWRRGDSRPRRIILVRHGAAHGWSHTCSCSVEGLPVCALKPETERPLTDEGKMQALQAGLAIKQMVGSETCMFYVSPFKSCTQTLRYILGSFSEQNVRCVEDPRLRNQNWGDWMINERPDVAKRLAADSERVGAFFYAPPQGESAAGVYDRCSAFLESLYRKWAQPNPPENVVIVAHNITIQVFLMRWFHWDTATFHRLKRFAGGQIVELRMMPDGSYELTTPLPCDGVPPRGVREIAPSIRREGSRGP